MTDLNKSSLEDLLQKMVDAGVDLSQYRRSPTSLLIPASMMQAAQEIFNGRKDYTKDVDFE